MMDMQTEPARIVGLLTSIVTAILALLVAFGLPLSNGQTGAILGVIAATGPVVAGFIIRRHVYAPKTVETLVGTPPIHRKDLY